MVLGEILTATGTAIFRSALYAIIAIGFTLIFGVGGILNFAHGAFITVGMFAAFLVTNPSGLIELPIWIGLLAGTGAGALLGAVTYVGVVRYVRDRSVTVLILTFVIGFFIIYAIRIGARNIFDVDNPLSIPVPQVMGTDFLNNVFILGGLGSIKGSIAGAYIIGFAETFTVNIVPGGPKLAGVSSLILLVAFLLVKPEGLFGRGAAE